MAGSIVAVSERRGKVSKVSRRLVCRYMNAVGEGTLVKRSWAGLLSSWCADDIRGKRRLLRGGVWQVSGFPTFLAACALHWHCGQPLSFLELSPTPFNAFNSIHVRNSRHYSCTGQRQDQGQELIGLLINGMPFLDVVLPVLVYSICLGSLGFGHCRQRLTLSEQVAHVFYVSREHPSFLQKLSVKLDQ